MSRQALVLLALALGGCAAPVAVGRWALPATTRRVQVHVAWSPARQLQAVAREHTASDVAEVDLALVRLDQPATLAPIVLAQRPVPTTTATLAGLVQGGRYQVTATALGDAVGTAPAPVLNVRVPARATFDAAATSVALPIQLDPLAFDATLSLPSNAARPGSVPSWVTRLDATLAEASASGTAIASATYTPGHTADIQHVRGDHDYVLGLAVHSLTGTSTMRLPGFRVGRTDGQDLDVVPDFGALVPPTGTLLEQFNLTGAFGVDLDAADDLWITDKTDGKVAEVTATGAAVIPAITVGSTPRSVAVDRAGTGVWVAESHLFGTIDLIADGRLQHQFGGPLFPAGLAVDPDHNVWCADVGGQVFAQTPAGTALTGSPFTVGSRPSLLAIDPTNRLCWVVNSNDPSISRITLAGAVSGPFATGTTPGGIAVAADGTVWVACQGDNALRRYHPDGSSAGTAVAVAGGPTSIAIDRATGAMWVTVLNGDQIAKVDQAGHVSGPFPIGAFPDTVAIDSAHHAWVAGGGVVSEIAP